MESPEKPNTKGIQYAMDLLKKPTDPGLPEVTEFSSFEMPKQSHRLIPIPKLDENLNIKKRSKLRKHCSFGESLGKCRFQISFH